MESSITVAVIAAASAAFGSLIGASANYFVSQRQFSRSGTRLLADLQILEKARAVRLDPALITAIENYVRERVEWHTHTNRPKK